MTSAARDHSVIAAGTVLACGVFLLPLAGPARAQGGGAKGNSQGLQRLWSTFPLRSQRDHPKRAAAVTRRASKPADSGSRSPALEPLVIGFGSVLGSALVIALLLVLRPRLAFNGLRVRRPRDRPSLLLKGLEMNDFMHRLLKTSNRRTVEPEAATADVFDQAPTDGGAPAVPEHSARLDATASEAPEADQASIEVGDQVAVILASAKQAAQRLHDSALQEAEHVREEAKRDADARLEVAGQELAERREEAETLRAEADAYSKSMREAADLHAAETGRKLDVELEQRRRDAEREANEIRRAAKLRADELASEALRRRGAIITEAERSEARLEQLLDVFRTVTSQLEDVLNERKALTGETRDLDEALRARTAGNPPA